MSKFKECAIEAANKANTALAALREAIALADAVGDMSNDDDECANDECVSFDSAMRTISELTYWWRD